MGTIQVSKDGQSFKVDENTSGAEIKRILALPPDSVLINARNEMIADNERIGEKVSDGESVQAVPQFKYW